MANVRESGVSRQPQILETPTKHTGRTGIVRSKVILGILFALFLISTNAIYAKTIGAKPGETVFAAATWYVNTFNGCNSSAGTATYSIKTQPQHGVATVETGSDPAPGCPDGSPALQHAISHYTMNHSTPPVAGDVFQLELYINGQDKGPVDIYVVNEQVAGKELGGKNSPKKQQVAEPVDVASGNMYYAVTDYTTAGQNPLTFTRYYNSLQNFANKLELATPYADLGATFALTTGTNWRSAYDRYLRMVSKTSIIAERPDGQQLIFTLDGSVWKTDSDINVSLERSGDEWILTDSNDTVETYTAATILPKLSGVLPYAQLDSIKTRNGYTQTLTYSAGNLARVTDSYDRKLLLAYSSGQLKSVTTPDGLVVSYTYDAAPYQTRLAKVSYSTSPATNQAYVYENTSLPFTLTGILDENGSRYATWGYDTAGRCSSSSLGVNANATSIVYNSDGSRVVKNAFGVQDTYTFRIYQNIPKIVQISRAATANTLAATEAFTYDANGFLASQTDWNGNKSTFVNSVEGYPTTVNEAVGTAQARTTTIAYNSHYPDLPVSIVTPGLTTLLAYDPQGDLTSQTLTDTTTQTVPYSTQGRSRRSIFTWTNSLLASVTTPKGNKTSFSYTAAGALSNILNPLNQATNITSISPGGYPRVIVDPNGVTTTLSYNLRQNLVRSYVTTKAGNLITQLIRDAAQNLTSVILPDGSTLTNQYDSAHRLVGVTDKLGNHVAYTLDALADRTATSIYASGGTDPQGAHSATFDALGRILTDIGGVGQTTTYSYDRNGNARSITDPLKHSTLQAFDALNRRIRATDANAGQTAVAYDAHDRPTTITDANGNSTLFVYDGFGEVIEQVSPDSGTTIYRYDADGNLIQKLDARNIAANYTYDVLERPLTTRYPADATLNVAYTYDETGHGFGIGRLTSVTDAAGALSRSYDERGNLLNETRVKSSTILSTSYTYDAASRTASITYPDGTLIKYFRDAAGQVSGTTATLPGATAKTLVSSVTHLPFGPINGMKYGNGIAETWTYDLDYRATNITDALSGKNVQNLTYGYDNDNNVKVITDAVNIANSQIMNYDVINRLTSAVSGTGGYGSLKWTYDKVSNRLTQTANGVLTSYTYTSGGNRLDSITTGGANSSVATSANGNITNIPPANSNSSATFVYSAANRMASVTGSPLAAKFVYDWEGQRFSKTNPGASASKFFSYIQGGALLAENDNGSATDYVYLDGRPIADLQPNTTTPADQINFMLADRMGTPQLAFNNGGATAWQTAYQPFGTTSNINGSIIQNLRFPGQYADTETSFHYNLNRNYMPNIGRFLETDRIGLGGGTNTYAYTGGNPLSRIDFSGDDFYDWILSQLPERLVDKIAGGQPYLNAYQGVVEGFDPTGLVSSLYSNQGLAENRCSTPFIYGYAGGTALGLLNAAGDILTGIKAIRAENALARSRKLLPIFSTGGNGRYFSGPFFDRASELRSQIENAGRVLDDAKWGLFQAIGQTLKEDQKCECQSK